VLRKEEPVFAFITALKIHLRATPPQENQKQDRDEEGEPN
jgi:hypothetical protein